jgi:hypothetical protein
VSSRCISGATADGALAIEPKSRMQVRVPVLVLILVLVLVINKGAVSV